MIEADKKLMFESVCGMYVRRALRSHFAAIHLLGHLGLEGRDAKLPTIIYANHSNWWDGLVAFYLSHYVWHLDSFLMMDIRQMETYSFFRWIGAFSVDRTSPREGVRSIEYAASLLTHPRQTLWMYPQGEMLHNDIRPFSFQSGIARIVQKAGPVNVISLSMRYEFLSEQRPEVFLHIGKSRVAGPKIGNPNSFIDSLRIELTTNLDALHSSLVRKEMGEPKTILVGKQSRNKTVDFLKRGA